ncbi:adenosylmethionine--8-amino-7-oxononanoate transaminase [Pedosphaera parvula]|uniref:Adenosylmethionine-8-amino-7-oxononanoate aminotransferase n=1 Tax=Pedosphaera parvula (strain Ellin514) TaxID=320771 RepID=B9XGM3_PEDPL|nr:adenosylmethionine--8-amino-7-oxononanoate transaminase [Pedosphaera parvula]EEF61074.1 aminotransferase class-III [Pedosphaera parvula Ellin514]
MHKLAQLDHDYVWHPFTQMRDWLKQEPIVITSGHGVVLKDARGKEYLDANSSIWTNLHGHNHPKINAAIKKQLGKISHSSALGFANEPASLLAQRLITVANALPSANAPRGSSKSSLLNPKLSKIFYSDDGSTAMEVALKLAYEYARRSGRSKKPKFLSLEGAYHGDTVGAVSVGHIDLFHKAYSGLLFQTDKVMAPYCYRCPFNRAKPERADARDYRKCNFECTGIVEEQFAAQKKTGNPYAAMVVEPLMQGAAGMIPQPTGWLRRVAEIVRGHGAQLVADEVMTGFGRTGSLFASHQESVQPDFLAVAKGMTAGYLPMAATLTTQAVFDAFLGDYSEFKTFFHGHSFTGNQLGAAAALASLDVLESKQSLLARQRLEETLRVELQKLWSLPQVGDIRQVGLVAGIELVKDWTTREQFHLRERAGIRVCEAMAKRGVLTRPIGSVVVLMPPYCSTLSQARTMVRALGESIQETFSTQKR